jgi:hypothetical protein
MPVVPRFVIAVVLKVRRRLRADRELAWAERVPPVGCERWTVVCATFSRCVYQAAAHRSFHRVLLCMWKDSMCSFVTAGLYSTSCFCVVFDRRPLVVESNRLVEDLEPADLDYGSFNAIRIVCVLGSPVWERQQTVSIEGIVY